MIIMISGKKGSGKTTLARAISEKYGLPIYSFATILKEIVGKMIGKDIDYVNRNKDLYCDILRSTIGQTLQQMGDAIQSINKKYFAEYLLWNIKGDAIIDDLRFPHEIEVFKGKDIYTIRIDHPSSLDSRNKDHHSETALDDYNDWSIVIPRSRDMLEKLNIYNP